jgi:ABC-type Co2+ transport system permease subunit
VIALFIDILAAWLVARYAPAGWKQVLAALVGGWAAAFADAAVMAYAFGWPPIEVLSRLTTGLLVHPLIVGGFTWLITRFLGRRKRSTDAA